MHVNVMPPLLITGDPALDWIIFFVVAGVCIYWVRALHLAREGVGLILENLAGASLVLIGSLFLIAGVLPQQQGRVVLASLIAILFFVVQQSKKRSRYIPRSVRRAVIARDLKGERFDSRKHHIDHVWPFALGGSHTVDNLRVIDKKNNLKKGAKRPPFPLCESGLSRPFASTGRLISSRRMRRWNSNDLYLYVAGEIEASGLSSPVDAAGDEALPAKMVVVIR